MEFDQLSLECLSCRHWLNGLYGLVFFFFIIISFSHFILNSCFRLLHHIDNNTLINSVLDCPLDSIEAVGERRMLAKQTSITDNPSHPLHETVGALSSSFSNRLLHQRCEKVRYHRSFNPTAVRVFNTSNP